MAMNDECKSSCSSLELNNSTNDDVWNDTSESETIDELPRLSIGSNDGINSTSRRVSFPKSDNDLITGYLEPANPWKSAAEIKSIHELTELYEESCKKHNTTPLAVILNHLQSLELKSERQPCLSLKNTALTPEACEALEEIFKRVQYELIDLSACHLNDVAGSALFDMIEYYEATNDLDISDNPGISTRGWQSCISMIRRSRALQNLTARGVVLSELNATNLGKSLNQSCLHTIKLEHCGLTGRPLASLCNSLRKNTTLRELWIAHNDLSDYDAEKLAELLKANPYLEFLDISNNNIKDVGVKRIVIALIEQSTNLQSPREYEVNSALNVHNNNVSQSCQTNSSSLYKASVGTDCPIDLNNQNSFSNVCVKNTGNVGRSMLDTLLNMNTKEPLKTVEEKSQISSMDNNETTTKDDKLENENTYTSDSKIDCGVTKENPNIIIQEEDNRSENATFPLNSDSSFSDDKSIESDFLGGKDQENENNGFKSNNNVLSYNENQDDIQANQALSTLDMNENTKTEEFDSNSSDSAFESASEGDTKMLVENFSKMNFVRLPPQQPEYNTKETANYNIILNERGTIMSETRNRSLSSDSLSSENSVDSSESQILTKINEHLTKNDTLTRQKHTDELLVNIKKARGLQALILWNNDITRDSGEYIADLLSSTTSLDLLNIGKNILSNDFIYRIKNSLQHNTTVTNLGLQSTHLTSEGIKVLADALQFGGNNTLQRIDIRDNNIQVEGLVALADALKSNNTVTRIDIDDIPKRIPDDGNETQFHYSRMLHAIRSLCSRNQKSQEPPTSCNNVKISRHYMSSRKISLTCQSLRTPMQDPVVKSELGLSDTVRKRSGTRLRSPLPSPPTISPSSSPVPSPSRNRFQVLRVIEKPENQVTQSETSLTKVNERSLSLPVKEVKRTRSRFTVTRVESCPTKLSEMKSTPEPELTVKTVAVTTESEILKNEKNIKKESVSQNEAKNEKELEKFEFDFEVDSTKNVTPAIEVCNVEAKQIAKINVTPPFDEQHLSELMIDEKDIEETSELSSSKDSLLSNSPGQIELDEMQSNENTLRAHDLSNQSIVFDESETKSNIQSPLKETSNLPTETKNETPKVDTAESRTRRVSWISSANYPATVDKLLNIFQNPGNLFIRSASPENDKKIGDHEVSSQSLIPIRKQSPPSMFHWNKTLPGEIKRTSSDNMISSNLQSYVRGIADFGKQVFKQNVPFMDSIPADTQQDCKSIPTDIKMEIKENISPEHTVTKNSIVSFQSVSAGQEMLDTSRESVTVVETNETGCIFSSTETTDTSYSVNMQTPLSEFGNDKQ